MEDKRRYYGDREAHASEQGQSSRSEAPSQKGILSDDAPAPEQQGVLVGSGKSGGEDTATAGTSGPTTSRDETPVGSDTTGDSEGSGQ